MDPFAARLRKENAAATFRPMLGIFKYHKGLKFILEPIDGVVVVQKNISPHLSLFRRGGGHKNDCARTKDNYLTYIYYNIFGACIFI